MSLSDDQAAEIDAQLDAAWQKSLYGKTYSFAFEVARNIKVIRKILAQKGRGKSASSLNSVERKLMKQMAEVLLQAAVTSSDKLRELADALDAEQRSDGRQANILKAYAACILEAYPPTLAEVKKAFVSRFGERLWGKDWSFRKTIKEVLDLPLRDDARGCPPGVRPLIRNRR